MKNAMTLKDLATKLVGNYWEKGDLKRVYLNEGNNTKKMSTKVYVYERNGSFVVNCKVECPSQAWQWCKSQEDQLIEQIENKINQIVRVNELELVKFSVVTEKISEIMVYVKEGDAEPSWFTEEIFYEKFGCYPFGIWPDVDAAYDEIRAERAKVPTVLLEPKKIVEAEDDDKLVISKDYEVGAKVRHNVFGQGEVTACSKGKVSVMFDDNEVGEKILLCRFTRLEVYETD